jgi:exodeoxyribonuclease VII small subunit
MTEVASTNPPSADVSTLSFEAAQAELEQIVEQLESPGTGLEQAIVLWERGEQLHAHCKTRLDAALAKIEKIELAASEVQQEAQVGTDEAFEPAAQESDAQSSDSDSSQSSDSGPVSIF